MPMKKSYFDVLKYPIALWIVFQLVAFVAGYTDYVNITAEMLLSNGAIFMAVLFGAWVGKRSSKAFNYLWVSMLNGLMISVIVGFVTLLLLFVLSTYSQNFISYMTQYSGGSPGPFTINTAIVLWVQMVMFSVVSAALAFEFSSKN
jgi:hypothetical protein